MFSLSVGTLISTLIEYKSSLVPVLLCLRPQAMCVFEIQKKKNKILLLRTLNTVLFFSQGVKSNFHSLFFSWRFPSPFLSFRCTNVPPYFTVITEVKTGRISMKYSLTWTSARPTIIKWPVCWLTRALRLKILLFGTLSY